MKLAKQKNQSKNPFEQDVSKEQLCPINHFIEETATVSEIADKANLYVNIRNAYENAEIAEYDCTSAIETMKKGLEQFGMTFNFTYGKETSDYLAYMCQKHFFDFIESIQTPSKLLKERKKDEQ